MTIGQAGLPAASAASASVATTTIQLDGYPLTMPVEPLVISGTNMVPFRAIAVALQVEVAWNAASQTITAVKQVNGVDRTVVLKLNDKKATVNGTTVLLHVAPIAKNGNTLVPLAFFSSQFGAKVAWDGPTRTVTIQSPVDDLYTLGYYAISSYSEAAYVSRFDSVAFGWSRIDGDGKLTLSGETFRWPQAAGETTPESLVTDAGAQGTLPYFMVFGEDGDGELTKLLNDPMLSQAAIDEMIRIAQENRFGGIALDFEGLGWTGDFEQAQQSYTAFVSALAEQAKPLGLKLSLALHPLNGAYHGYDYKELAKVADELVIMAYHYEDETRPEPMKRVDESIRLALKEAPAEKLVLGISFGSEDESSVNAKIGLAKRYNLKGIAIWRIGIMGQAAMAKMQQTIVMD